MKVTVPQLSSSDMPVVLSRWCNTTGEMVYEGQLVAEITTKTDILQILSEGTGNISEAFFKEGESVSSGDILAMIRTVNQPKDFIDKINDDINALEELAIKVDILADRLSVSAETKAIMQEYGAFSDNPQLKKITTVRDPTFNEYSINDPDGRKTETIPIDKSNQVLIDTNICQTLVETVNMQVVEDFYYKFADEFHKKYQVKLGTIGFVVKATIEALKAFPVVNATVDNDSFIYHNYHDILITDFTGKILLKNAEFLSLADIEKQAKIIEPKDITPVATFEIVNNQSLSVHLSARTLLPNQKAILSTHKTSSQPIVIDGRIAIRPMMNLSLTYQKSAIDDKTATLFLNTVKDNLQDLNRLLLT